MAKTTRRNFLLALSSILLLTGCPPPVSSGNPSPRNVTTLLSSRGVSDFSGITVDSFGRIYVAAYSAHVIYRMNSDGSLSRFAGTPGRSGSRDGAGTEAEFTFPTGLTSDREGNIYVADTGNSLIRKINSEGRVTTVCEVSANGIARSSSGVFYVSSAHAILKVDRACVVTVFAGDRGSYGFLDETGAAARFNGPWDLALDSSENLFVVDSGNHSVRKIDSRGVVSTFAGGGDSRTVGIAGASDGSGRSARFRQPLGIGMSRDGMIYVTDSGNNTLRQISPAGEVTTLAGTPGTFGNQDGTGSSARFNGPSSLAVDESGTIVLSDVGNRSIRLVK